MRPPRRSGLNRPARTSKSPSQGVDVLEKGCIMCGSLGHFGADGAQQNGGAALRPVPTIFDSVRR
jgi:hypothetical protein